MANQTVDRQRIRINSGINAVLGLWLILASFILGYSTVPSAQWNEIIVGIVILVLAGIRVSGRYDQPALSWVNVVLGVWLIISPFLLAYSGVPSALWNSIIVGLLVAILAWRSASASPK